MFEMLKKGVEKVKAFVVETVDTAKAYVGTLLGGTAAVGAATYGQSVSAQVTLPDPGVDLTDYIPLMVTQLGGIVGAVVAAWIAFRVISIGLRKLNKVGG